MSFGAGDTMAQAQPVTIDQIISDGFNGLPDRFLVMVTSSPANYVSTIFSVLRHVMAPDTVGIYISVNKPYFALTPLMQAQKIPIENMYFLDCASGLLGKPPQELEKAYILSGPANLTELSITLAGLLEKLKGREDKIILFLDSVSTFLIYNHADIVAKFLHAISGKVRTHNISGVFFSLREDIMKGAVASTVQFHDKVLETG